MPASAGLASLGRNEECGLRCVYHGWKFDVAGACTDMMNKPEENDFRHKVRLTAYPTCRTWRHGLGLSRSGRTDAAAAEIRLDRGAATHLHVTKVIQECDWLQGLEGGIDTSHAPIMHGLISESSTRAGFKPSNPFVRGKAPKLVVDLTDYGYQSAGIRPLGEDECMSTTYRCVLPFHQIRPSAGGERRAAGLPAIAGFRWMMRRQWCQLERIARMSR